MYEQQYAFELTGISPLIMHWDNIEWADQIEEERTRIKREDKANFKAGDDRCPPFTWQGYVYCDQLGEYIAMPADNLRSCLMKAAAKVSLKGKETFKRLSQSSILFDGLDFPMFFNGSKQIPTKAIVLKGSFAEQAAAVQKLGFKLFVKRAKIGQNKHVRVRPIFEHWSCSGTFTVVNDQITLPVLEDIWGIGGPYVGLCDWRPGAPQSPGPYGRFTTKLKAV